MSDVGTVLVVGAGGSAAGTVVPALVDRDVRVRGLVHRPEQRDGVLGHGAAEVVVGDLTDEESMRVALQGVTSVFYIAPAFMPDEADVGTRMVQLARDSGVRRFVFSSVIHPVLSLANHAGKAPVEEALYDSGMEYVVLQPSLFFQNYDRSWKRIVATGVLAEPWSVNTRFSRVDYRDVADAAALALTEDRLVGGTYELASDGHLDRRDVALMVSGVAGRPIRAERTDAPANVPPAMRRMMEHYDHSGLLSTSVVLTAVLGRQPRSLRDYFIELHNRDS